MENFVVVGLVVIEKLTNQYKNIQEVLVWQNREENDKTSVVQILRKNFELINNDSLEESFRSF